MNRDDKEKADLDKHANQLNPNNAAYWSSRGGQDDDCTDESGAHSEEDD